MYWCVVQTAGPKWRICTVSPEALGIAAITSGAKAFGTYAGKKAADKITGNSGWALKLPGKIGGGLKLPSDTQKFGWALRLPETEKIIGMGNDEVP